MKRYIIAVDGAPSDNKQKICINIASNLGFVFINAETVYYSIVAYLLSTANDLNNNLSPELLQSTHVQFDYEGFGASMTINNEVTFQFDSNINTVYHPEYVKHYTNNILRKFVADKIRELARNYSLIVSGFDVTTFLLTSADLKLFIYTSSEKRTNNYLISLIEKCQFTPRNDANKLIDTYAETLSDFGLLMVSKDATIIDVTDFGIDDSIYVVERVIKEKMLDDISDYFELLHIAKEEDIEDSRKTTTPPELNLSILNFNNKYLGSQTAFIMMKYRTTNAHNSIVEEIKNILKSFGIIGLRADDGEFNSDLLNNIRVYMHACDFGIAIHERLTEDDFNPNVTFEVGYMYALNKDVCLLKDSTLKTLHTDIAGKMYRTFDAQNTESLRNQLISWLNDKGYIKECANPS